MPFAIASENGINISGDQVSLSVVSHQDAEFDLGHQDEFREILSQGGINSVEATTTRQPRWVFMREVGYWETSLDKPLGFGIGDKGDPISYFPGLTLTSDQLGGTDVHIYPTTGDGRDLEGRVEVRVDGTMVPLDVLSREELTALTSYIHRVSGGKKDGTSTHHGQIRDDGGGKLDLRVTSMPKGNGLYSTAIRIARRNLLEIKLEELGFLPNDIKTMRHLLEEPQGFIVLAGSTGSGKTTTSYALLHELTMKRPRKRIISFEDPIESEIPGVSHHRVYEDGSGGRLTIDDALAGSRRLDPDVIFLGEALRGAVGRAFADEALTSHQYLVTMHAQDVPSTIGRFEQWGVGGRTINMGLQGIVVQRLLRRSCPECSVERPLDEKEIRYFFPKTEIGGAYDGLMTLLQRVRVKESKTGKKNGKWCDACQASKYRGRFPIVEIYTHDVERYPLVQQICSNDADGDIGLHKLYRQGPFEPMGLSALYNIVLGNTTL